MSDNNGFAWIEDLGMGHCPVLPQEGFYGQEYWDEYVKRANASDGIVISNMRVDLVNRCVSLSDEVLDVGIGCGQFIETRSVKTTLGFDVNPVGVAWLNKRGLYRDPREGAANMTFWDALEHIEDASRVFSQCRGYAFVTMPIYRDRAHVQSSKHFKPGEHLWYFTRQGLIRWARGNGFELVEHNCMEQKIGREDIETFVFRNQNGKH